MAATNPRLISDRPAATATSGRQARHEPRPPRRQHSLRYQKRFAVPVTGPRQQQQLPAKHRRGRRRPNGQRLLFSLRASTRRGIWCHNGTMKRMNLRDVPDDVYAALVSAAEAHRQSLSAFVVDRLTEVAQVSRLEDYLASYQAPRDSGVTVEDAAAAVREVRQAS